MIFRRHGAVIASNDSVQRHQPCERPGIVSGARSVN